MAERHEIRSLTGLRGVAALLVVAFHYAFLPLEPGTPNPVGPGYLAVDLFFILSGFVMAATYAGVFAAGFDAAGYTRFLTRRFARVYPLYAVALLAAYLLAKLGLMQGYYNPTRTLASNLLGLQNLGAGLLSWHFARNLNVPSWSISTELGAYLLFPWLAAVTLFRSRRAAAVAGGLALAGLLAVAALPDNWAVSEGRQGPLDVANGDTLWPLLRCLAGFTLGLLTFRLSRVAGIRGRLSQAAVDAALMLAIAAAWRPGMDMIVVLLFAPLIWHLSTDASPLSRLLGSRVPHFLGEVSYSLYLTHALVAQSLAAPLHAALLRAGTPHAWTATLPLLTVASLAISFAAYRLVERPARGFIRKAFELRWSAMRGRPLAPRAFTPPW